MPPAAAQVLGAFAGDDRGRGIVMTGAGDRAFVSGADISEFEQRRSDPESIKEYDAVGARVTEAYRALEKPLIAMVRGYALGGGLVTALRADLRIASENAQLGIPAVRLGLGPGGGRYQAEHPAGRHRERDQAGASGPRPPAGPRRGRRAWLRNR